MGIGDTIQCKDKSLLVIENKTIIATFVQVYNLEVEDNENYYVTEDGILVHNGYKSRLPRSDGEWIDGEPGNGLWKSDNPNVNEITGGEAIPFKDGRPDFSQWSVGEPLTVKGMNGTDADFSKIHDEIKIQYGMETQAEAKAWLSGERLTPHHLDTETVILVPTDLHGNIPHIGSASDMRNMSN